MRHELRATALLLLALASGCAATAGDGIESMDTREVAPFLGLHVQNGIRTEVIVGEQRVLTVRADDNLLSLIETTVAGDALSIRATSPIAPVIPPEVSIGAERLEFISAREQGSVALAHRVVAERFGAAASDGAAVQVGGACRTLSAIASDGGHLDARSLLCDDVRVDARGGAVVEVTALRRAEVHASGQSVVIVRGNPGEVVRTLTDDAVLTLEP